jgi:predicted transcriptional regulator
MMRENGRPASEHAATLKSEIAEGLADIAAGRVREFDISAVIERGKALLAKVRAAGDRR